MDGEQMKRVRLFIVEHLPMLVLLVLLVHLIGCGTTPREQVASEERWFTATIDVLTQARLSHAISKSDYHNVVLPAEEIANAALESAHRQAATQPSLSVDRVLEADAAWREAKAQLLQWLLVANKPTTRES
jgi:hypothetical protein